MNLVIIFPSLSLDMQKRMILGDSPPAAQYVMSAIYWDRIAVKQRRKHFTHLQ